MGGRRGGWGVLLAAAMLWLPLRRAAAQDMHFSMPDASPALLNPAYTGFFEGKGRFGVAYRNQWATVTNPYQTLAATAEVSMARRRYQRDGVSIGAQVAADREGTLRYGSRSATAMLSYYKAVGRSALLSVGVQGGVGFSGFDASDARFGEVEETLGDHAVHYPLLAAGMAAYWQPSDLLSMKVGVAGHNLNRPNISHLGLDDVYLERRYNIYARAEWRYWGAIAVLPMAMAQWQRNYSELLVGSDVKWYVTEDGGRYLAFSGGLYYRFRDALLATLSLDYNAFLFALAYDANFSKLTPASRSVGAFELQVIYRMGKTSRVRYKTLPCPIF